jgi:hypothetical protein
MKKGLYKKNIVLTITTMKLLGPLQEHAKAVDVPVTPSLVDREDSSYKLVVSIILSS